MQIIATFLGTFVIAYFVWVGGKAFFNKFFTLPVDSGDNKNDKEL